MGRESFYVFQNTMRGMVEIIELDISSDMILDGLGFMDKK